MGWGLMDDLQQDPPLGRRRPRLLQDHRWRDIDRDGASELFLTLDDLTLVFGWRNGALEKLPFEFPAGPLVRNTHRDSGVRFVDLNNDQRDD